MAKHEPRHIPTFEQLYTELKAWVTKHPDDPTMRLNGQTSGSSSSAFLVFPVMGFQSEDYKPTPKEIENGVWHESNGRDFNTRFALAADTQVQGAAEFVRLYESSGGDVRKIFKPGFAWRGSGASGRLKLYLNTEKAPDGWNCLKFQK